MDELEVELQEELKVLRVNIQQSAGKEIAARYGFEFTPTFLLFDAEGEILLRTVGMIDPASIRSLLGLP